MKQKILANVLKGSLSLICCTILLAAFASPGLSQENTGSIRGIVNDQTGAAIPGAKVTASSSALVRPLEVTSDGTGAYIFPKLPAGIYSITASLNGFKTVKKDDISVQLGRELSLELSLPAGNVTEQVNISAAAEALDVTSSRTATTGASSRRSRTSWKTCAPARRTA